MDTEGGWRVQCALIGVTLFVFGIGVWATAPEPANPVDDAPEPRVAPLSFEAGLDAQKQRIESARTVAGHSRWDGTYRYGNGYDSRELLFAHGQGFVYHAGTCVGSYASFGDISDGADGLRLTRRQQSAALAGLAEPKALLPVPWGRRRYLVPENRLGDFALAIHAGVEPRCGHWGRFLLRGGDERRVVSGLPELPAAWQGLLRRKALVLHVSALAVDEEADVDGSRRLRYTLTLDGGADRGLLVGASLRPLQLRTAFSGSASVVEVHAHEAIARYEHWISRTEYDNESSLLPPSGGSHPIDAEVVGPAPGVAFTTGAVPADIDAPHCRAVSQAGGG